MHQSWYGRCDSFEGEIGQVHAAFGETNYTSSIRQVVVSFGKEAAARHSAVLNRRE